MTQATPPIVVLGHHGFIGQALFTALQKTQEATALHGLSSRDLDLADKAACQHLGKLLTPDSTLIWCAAVKRQSGDHLEALESNFRITLNLAQMLSRFPVGRLIYFSSTAVYGEDVAYADPIHEDTPTQPVSYYGIAKDSSERILAKLFTTMPNSTCLMLRPPLVYGPGEAKPSYGPNLFLQSLMQGHQELALWGDGQELREFLFIEDLVSVTLGLLNTQASGRLNLVSGHSHSFLEAARMAETVTGREGQISSRPRTKQAVNHVFDNQRLQQLLPEFAFTPLQPGMTRTMNYLHSHSVTST